MTNRNIIIVGTGPAGLSAAKILSQFTNVTLVGRPYRPEKPCGGGLTQRCIRILDKVFPGYVEIRQNHIYQVLAIFRRGAYLLSGKEPLITTVRRGEFDIRFLKHVTDNEGVEYISENIVNIEKKNGKYVLTSDRDTTIEADIVIACDGVTSRIRKIIENRRYVNLPLALRTYCRSSIMTGIDIAVLDFSKNMDYGYYWIFPLKDRVNIGIGAFRPRKNLRRDLEEYITILGLEKIHNIDGHYLPENVRELTSEDSKILYTGDAAGLIDYTLGEGITYAIISGIEAAIACLKDHKRPGETYKLLMKDLTNDLKLTRKIAIHVPYRIDRILDIVIRKTITTGRYSMKILRGEETYHKAIKKLLSPKKLINTLLKP